jgi:hypothetical protein
MLQDEGECMDSTCPYADPNPESALVPQTYYYCKTLSFSGHYLLKARYLVANSFWGLPIS